MPTTLLAHILHCVEQNNTNFLAIRIWTQKYSKIGQNKKKNNKLNTQTNYRTDLKLSRQLIGIDTFFF